MKVAGARGEYYTYTSKASDVGRQLALGAIAVVWLLHGPSTTLAFPRPLLVSLGAFCLSLALDFLQYLVSSAIWGIYARSKEKQFQSDGIDLNSSGAEMQPHECINWPGIAFFWLKALALIIGAVILGIYLVARIKAA